MLKGRFRLMARREFVLVPKPSIRVRMLKVQTLEPRPHLIDVPKPSIRVRMLKVAGQVGVIHVVLRSKTIDPS